MKTRTCLLLALATLFGVAQAKIGDRFPSEKKVVIDPVTGVPLTFLTSTPAGDSKIYPTHRQWTADGKWVVFRSNRVRGEAMAVNEESGVIVQVTEGGYIGMLCLASHAMKMYFFRPEGGLPAPAAPRTGAEARPGAPRPSQLVEVDLGKLFADSEAGRVTRAADYERVCGTIPLDWGAGGDLAIDADEQAAYFRVAKEEAAKHLPADAKIEANFGPRHLGAGPTGLGRMDLKTGALGFIVAVPFQIGHVQTNPWVPGEIVFCWETGGKSRSARGRCAPTARACGRCSPRRRGTG
ncbi:hypothetical protein [Oleiharenicola sp. Vm1]|uniref:hypothetical protein n=1 Tax=Oleiharenicola sp. Vm1 TaxID=3398393 RepID=UPI0039F500CB